MSKREDHRNMNRSWIFFMVGLIPFVLAYYPIKHSLPAWLFVSVSILYLILLRIFSDYMANKLSKNSDEQGQ